MSPRAPAANVPFAALGSIKAVRKAQRSCENPAEEIVIDAWRWQGGAEHSHSTGLTLSWAYNALRINFLYIS